jgi:serine protease Do
MKARHATIIALPCALIVGTTAFLAGSLFTPRAERHDLIRSVIGPERIMRNPAGGQTGFADVVDVVRPAVIGIRTKVAAGSGSASPLDRFGRLEPKNEPNKPADPNAKRMPGMPPALTTQGSGFFVSADGYAVTNNHVIEGNETAEIQTDDQKTYTAKVVGTDPGSDLALLKVDGRNDFAFATIADDPPRVGDWILAVGNPFGLGGTVTAGIVSARERNIGMSSYEDLIQIDAPVNQGASGGPTFDVRGRVIGVNTMILSPSGGSVGIAFAIPAETVKAVIPQLKEKGSVTRGWLGIQFQPVTPEIAEGLGLKEARGALVVAAQPDGPASKAGIAPIDIITSINDEAVKDGRDLAKKINHIAPGTSLKFGIIRRSAPITVSVTIGERPVAESQASGRAPTRFAEQPNVPSHQPELKLAPANSIPGVGDEGVVVTDIDLNGRAAAQGMEPGDIIFEVNGKRVRSPEDVRNALREAHNEGKRTALMRLNSGEAARVIAVPVDVV